MRREVPLIIAFVTGVLYILNSLVQVQIGPFVLSQTISELNTWVLIIAAFAIGLASVNLMVIHSGHVKRRREGWYNSILLIGSFILFTLVGILATTFQVTDFVSLNQNLFQHVQSPLGATMWAMVGFFICSSAYRAFKARTAEATVMLLAAVILMLGRAPVGEMIWGQFPVIGTWLLNVPHTAGQRAIMIGAAVGGFTVAMRLMLGIERGYLGGE